METSYNISGGINYSKELGKFKINSGFQLSYLHTGKGNQTCNRKIVLTPDTNLIYKTSFNETVSLSSGNSYGVGFFLGAEFNVLSGFTVGAEFHQFLYYSVFDNNSDINDNSVYTYNGTNFYYCYKKRLPKISSNFHFQAYCQYLC